MKASLFQLAFDDRSYTQSDKTNNLLAPPTYTHPHPHTHADLPSCSTPPSPTLPPMSPHAPICMYLHQHLLELVIGEEAGLVLGGRVRVPAQSLHVVHRHLQDGQLVQSARNGIAGRDHLGQLRHVPVHALPPLLLNLTVL